MIIHNDCIKAMSEMEVNSVDAIVTDPPYGLEFMGKKWDKLWRKGDSPAQKACNDNGIFRGVNPRWRDITLTEWQNMQLWHVQWLTEAYRVLKPGGSMLVMGGTRTFHRLMVAIEDTGFILKDTLMWMYGSGFPKAQDLGKLIDKKAGKEREVIGINEEWRKKTKAERERGVSNINLRSRNLAPESYPTEQAAGYHHPEQVGLITAPATDLAKYWHGFKVGGIKPAYEPIVWAVKPPEGSYTDNILKWGVGGVNVDECRISLDGEKQPSGSAKIVYKSNQYAKEKTYGDNKITPPKGRFPANVILDEEAGQLLDEQSDGVSRFFYCAKASKSERNAGLEKNDHPTVKPIALFKYLIKLVTRKGQTVLDPFMGSGTTGCACAEVEREFIGIEKEAEYIEIAKKRIEYWSKGKSLNNEVLSNSKKIEKPVINSLKDRLKDLAGTVRRRENGRIENKDNM